MEFSVRRIMLGEIAGTEQVGSALALDSVTMKGTKVLGPVVGGLLYKLIGLEGAYVASAIIYRSAVLLVAGFRYRQTERIALKIRFAAELFDSFRYAGTNKSLLGMFIVTVRMNVFCLSFCFDGSRHRQGSIGTKCPADRAVNYVQWPRRGGGSRIHLRLSTTQTSAGLLFRLASQSCRDLCLFLFAEFLGRDGHSLRCWSLQHLRQRQSVGHRLSEKMRGMRSRMMGALIMCVGVGYFGLLHPGFMAGVYGRAMAVAVMPAEGLVARVAVFLLWPVLRKSR